jgi:hypothetical protein
MLAIAGMTIGGVARGPPQSCSSRILCALCVLCDHPYAAIGHATAMDWLRILSFASGLAAENDGDPAASALAAAPHNQPCWGLLSSDGVR